MVSSLDLIAAIPSFTGPFEIHRGCWHVQSTKLTAIVVGLAVL
jgi:hypothetical protein